MKLYSYWRSSAAYRVRIGLKLKNIAYEYLPVALAAENGAQHSAAYAALNPQQLVPTLVDGDTVIRQSLAILEYLEECFPVPPLLPSGPVARARVREIALLIAADLHPLNNLRVMHYLEADCGLASPARRRWYHHWLKLGFDALEPLLDEAGPYALGGAVTLADLCIVPQAYNARRYDFPFAAYPRLLRVVEACSALGAFAAAAPELQPDAPPPSGA